MAAGAGPTLQSQPVSSLLLSAPSGAAAPDRVYNLEVRTHHTYFVDGVLVHNVKFSICTNRNGGSCTLSKMGLSGVSGWSGWSKNGLSTSNCVSNKDPMNYFYKVDYNARMGTPRQIFNALWNTTCLVNGNCPWPSSGDSGSNQSSVANGACIGMSRSYLTTPIGYAGPNRRYHTRFYSSLPEIASDGGPTGYGDSDALPGTAFNSSLVGYSVSATGIHRDYRHCSGPMSDAADDYVNVRAWLAGRWGNNSVAKYTGNTGCAQQCDSLATCGDGQARFQVLP
jgi:hypothetical protein